MRIVTRIYRILAIMKRTAQLVLVTWFALCCSLFAGAQTASTQSSNPPAQTGVTHTNNPLLENYGSLINTVLTAPQAGRGDAIDDLLDIGGHPRLFLEYAAANAPVAVHDELANLVEQSRLDEQLGAGPNSGGSASAVAKAGLASLLSAAIESGAITQALNGNTATLNGNGDGVLRFLSGREPFPYCPPTLTSGSSGTAKVYKDCGTPVLKDLGFSLSFDMNQSATKPVATTPAAGNPQGTPPTLSILTSHNQFSGASAKYVFRNPRDVRSKSFQKAWSDYYQANRTKFQQAGNALLDALIPAIAPLSNSKDYESKQEEYATRLRAASNDRNTVERIFQAYLDDVIQVARKVTPKFDGQVRNAVSAYMRYLGNVRPMLQDINTKTVFSAEWNFERPQGQPDIQHFRMLSTLNPFGPNGTLSVNLAGTIYNSSSVSAKFGRWRDAQASLQLERRISGDLADYPARFSLAGYFQYMISPGLISFDSGNVAPGTTILLPKAAAIALAPAGPIWIAEAQIVIKLKSSGAEIPFAITRANRTDLIKATSTRGHIGITYDLDKLFTNK
jgi:hypothetical protein